jgi:seryl-tRNA synthetase
MPELFKKPEEPKEKKKGLFGGSPKTPPPDPAADTMTRDVENAVSRLRVLEERHNNVRAELKITEENMLHKSRKLKTELKTIISDINELRRENVELKSRMLSIMKELQNFAARQDVEVLRKYIEIWEPMNFVTHKELEEVVMEKIKKVFKARTTARTTTKST